MGRPYLHNRLVALDVIYVRQAFDRTLATLIPATVGAEKASFLEDGVRAALRTTVLWPGTVPVGAFGLASEQPELSGVGVTRLIFQMTSKGCGHGIGR